MGACGCGDYQPRKQYAIRGCVVGVEIYPGCQDCTDLLGVAVSFFTPNASFVKGNDTTKVTPDDCGGEVPGIPLFSVEDLREAAKEMDPNFDPDDPDGYATLDDWLQDNGLRMLQRAIQIREKKHREELAKLPEVPRE